MARVTVEDCILHIPNRFELVLLASTRAKHITSGNPLTIDRDNDKTLDFVHENVRFFLKFIEFLLFFS